MENYSQIDQQLTAWIDAHRDEIVQTTQEILHIPSVKGEPADGAPFGIETRRALDYAMSVSRRYGLTTKNLEGYAAHAEWIAPGVAPDAEIVAALAHVDVVPEGAGWAYPPFGAEIVEGRIYARGAIDDKGPAISALYALLALKETNAPLARRIRVILGADEESGFGCVRYYFQHEEMPAVGFTPDGEFPLIHAEKGIANAVLTCPAPSEGERLHLNSLQGGRRPNMVPDHAEALLSDISAPWPAVKARLNSVVGISTEETEDSQHLRVMAKGVSAHGSTPQVGLNAIVLLCDALLLLDHQEDHVKVIQKIYDWGKDTTGAALGIAGEDEIAGPLTCNLGIAEIKDDTLSLTFNIRYPVTWTGDSVREKIEATIAATDFQLAMFTDAPPLLVPLDDPLIQSLLEVYRAETGDQTAPMTTGGGTYARAIKKGVAYGASFRRDEDQGAHEVNESWGIDDLIQSTKIFAKSLLRLANQ